jgi:hypothetical protein
MPNEPFQLALWRDNPVTCVHCLQVVARLPEPNLLEILRAHQCTSPERWAA